MIYLVFLWMLFKIFHPVVLSADWPIRRESFIDGDLILGGFFPIHGSDNEHMCGKLQAEGLIQLEAMLFTVQRINNNSEILPNKTLGVLALDSCDSVAYALEGAVEFAKGFIVKDDSEKKNHLFACDAGENPVYKSGMFEKVVAVVGGHSSWVSMQIADLLRIYKTPQVSYQSTNPDLSDKNKYKYFFRTVPPLYKQIDGILGILKEFNWTYVSVVYADSSYGNNGFKYLNKIASRQRICFSYQKRINVENSKDESYDSVIKELLRRNATVVIVFSGREMARNLMAAATRSGNYSRFVWIGSTAWVSRDYVTSGNEEVLEGAIGITHDVQPLRGFKKYLKSRKLNEHASINPWFPEHWEERLKCKLDTFDKTPYNRNFTKSCSVDAQLPYDCYLQSAPSVQFVRDAVYAIAYALHKSVECDKSRVTNSDSRCMDLVDYLQKVEFPDAKNNLFQFNEYGDGPPRYSVVNFQKVNDSKYDWVKVGSFSNFESNKSTQLHLKDTIRFKHDNPSFPKSLCSSECVTGQAKIYLDDASCCWHCRDCSEYQYVENGTRCEYCPFGEEPSKYKRSCKSIALEFMTISNSWAIGCVAFSISGIIMTLCVGGIFWKYRDTPIFMASGRELSCVLLIGTLLLFSMTFVITSKPSSASCGIERFFIGFCYTISYATIMAKARHISKLSKQKVSKKKPKPVNTKSLLLVTLALISVEGTINATWMIHSRPATDSQFPSRTENILICKGSDKPSHLVGLVYPFLLMVYCTVYAFQNRKFTGAFNESRYINFTNYTTFVLWLAFLPTFLLNCRVSLRVVVLSMLLNVSALAQLVCLFLPKVYIALRRPEKNVHENVMCYEVREPSPNVKS